MVIGLSQAIDRRRSSQAPVATPSFDGMIQTDADAARLIRFFESSDRKLEPWIQENRDRFGLDFVRHGGLRRLNLAVQIIKDQRVDILTRNIPGFFVSDRENELVCRLLALGAHGIEQIRDVSLIQGDFVREMFEGNSVICLRGKFVDAEGTGRYTSGYDPFRTSILYKERK